MNDDEIVEQSALFAAEPDWAEHWQGMPEYKHEDLQPYQSVIVHFRNQQDRIDFAKLVNQPLTAKTKSIWHPRAVIGTAADKVFTGGTGAVPRYPVYIISKGRWESRLTSKALEWIKVPYHIVVEPQEYAQYAAVIDPAKILVLPFSNLGLGGIPARNWVYEHAVATGAERHWILDDNISGFCRFHDNLKVEVDSGATFCAVEDWCDRYENVVMAAFNYDYFAPRKQGAKIKPITLNTRCYSGILLSNKVPHRWRGRYNEDTDLSLRLLKDGFCTALFNAFLMYKKPTLTMKGGNTDELYAGAEAAQKEWEAHAAECAACKRCTDGYGSEVQPCAEGRVILEKDGRWRMAEHLREQHPDVTSVERKWGRWQHLVDYRQFRNNELVMRPDFDATAVKDYGMTLDAMPTGWGAMGHDRRNSLMGDRRNEPTGPAEAPVGAKPARKERPALPAAAELGAAPRPSALSFALARKAAPPEPPKVVNPMEALKKALDPKKEKVDGAQGANSPNAGGGADGPVDQSSAAAGRDGTSSGADAGRQAPDVPGDDVGHEPSTVSDRTPSVAVPITTEPLTVGLSPAEVKLRLDIRGHRVLKLDDYFFITNAERLTPEDDATIKALGHAFMLSIADEWDGKEDLEQVKAPQPQEVSHVGPSGSESDVRSGQAEESSGALVHVTPLPFDGGGGEVAFPAVHAPESAPPSINEDPGLLGFNAGTPFFDEAAPPQTLAQFLGSEPLRVDPNYVADEPPDLTDIDEVVLNFATDGVDWVKGHRPGGLTVSTMDGQMVRFLPFRFLSGNLDEGQIKRWAQEQLRGKKIYNAKTKFDVHMAREWGVDLEAQGCRFSDIQHTAALLDDNTKRVGLDVLQPLYLPDLPPVARVDESRHLEHGAAEVAERERYTASLVWRLRDVMYPMIDQQELRAVQDLEDSVISAVVEMERNGSPIDMELLERYGRECNAEHGRLMMEISAECGFAFEHTAAGWKRLIDSLGLTPPDGFSESALNEVDHPLIRKGQRASQYANLNSKIFKAYPDHIVDGILRYDINQLANDEGGTRSGRFSIGIVQQVPNYDNHFAAFGDSLYPRNVFIPGVGALDYGEADAAQIEFRLLVHYSQNKKLLQAYRDDPKMSFHKSMQKELIVYKPDMLYTHTKSYNFAAQYGARSIKLAIMMGFITERQGAEIRQAKRWDDPRLKTIKEIEAAYKAAHPEAGELLDRASHLAKTECDQYCRKGDKLHKQYPHRGFVKTLVGRRSRFPTNYKTYIGLNRVLQGTGADIMKKKLAELHTQRKETGFVMRITNHDAVLGDVTREDTMAKVAAILDAQSYALSVPILWECKRGPNWGAVKNC